MEAQPCRAGTLCCPQLRDLIEGYRMSPDNEMISDLLTYAKSLPSEPVSKLEKVDFEKAFIIHNESPIACSLDDGEITETVLNEGDRGR
ncbi:hypothetical protein M514_00763 [Trichuris suis]|uniref:Uncharacterized protein n=1 Tax=Trichuris suis TaxID=68888 RepID=A0A085MMU1_9BILA|nr:hypothetical protein M513_00763 [Trichuris suis]KFD66089.1 hypothetical protein M514_00763 [Trichuris suis]